MQQIAKFMYELISARIAEEKGILERRAMYRERFFHPDCFWDNRKGTLEMIRLNELLARRFPVQKRWSSLSIMFLFITPVEVLIGCVITLLRRMRVGIFVLLSSDAQGVREKAMNA